MHQRDRHLTQCMSVLNGIEPLSNNLESGKKEKGV